MAYPSIINILLEDSARMTKPGLQAARQVGLQLLQFIEGRDRTSGLRTRCSAWTFSHETIVVGLGVRAHELFDLPLQGHGPSRPDLALRAVASTTRDAIEAARLHAADRRGFRASVRTVLIGDPSLVLQIGDVVRDLPELGPVGLVLIDSGFELQDEPGTPASPFATIVLASQISQQDLEAILGR